MSEKKRPIFPEAPSYPKHNDYPKNSPKTESKEPNLKNNRTIADGTFYDGDTVNKKNK